MTGILGFALLTMLDETPIQRLQRYTDSVSGLVATGRATIAGKPGEATFTYVRNAKVAHAFRFTMPKVADWDYRQNGDRAILSDHMGRLYQQLAVGGGLAVPPEPVEQEIVYCFPTFLALGPKVIADLSKWKAEGTEKSAHGTLEISVYKDTGGIIGAGEEAETENSARVVIKTDSVGRPWEAELEILAMGQNIRVHVWFESVSERQPDEGSFSLRPINGFVPDSMQETSVLPSVGNPVTLRPVTEAVGGRKLDLAAMAKSTGVVVLVTSEDCKLSRKGAELWNKMAGEMKSRQEFVEVVVGSQGPDLSWREGRKVCFDPDGSFERSLGVPTTPLVIAIGQDGNVKRVWSGYWDGCEAEALKVVKGAFKS